MPSPVGKQLNSRLLTSKTSTAVVEAPSPGVPSLQILIQVQDCRSTPKTGQLKQAKSFNPPERDDPAQNR